MIGLIVIANENAEELGPDGVLSSLVGVPVLVRATAAALPADAPVRGVVVVPKSQVDATTAELERFGLLEIDRVVAAGPGLKRGITAGLAALGDDIDRVIVQHGNAALVPAGLVDRVLAALTDANAASACAAAAGNVAVVADGAIAPVDGAAGIRVLQDPQAFKHDVLIGALERADDDVNDAALWVASGGGRVSAVDGDLDNRRVREPSDLGRALEVFARRAADFAFLYPKDLLPTDPLAVAMSALEGASGPTEG